MASVLAPEWELDASEARDLAQAIEAVERHYKVPKFAQKTYDWLTLASTAGTIYGARLTAYRIRKAREAPPKPTPGRPPGPPPVVVRPDVAGAGVPLAADAIPRGNGAEPLRPASPQSPARTADEYDQANADPRRRAPDIN